MRLNELKTSNQAEVVRCQLMISEEKTTKGDNYLKLEFSDRTKVYINIFNSNPKYQDYVNLGLNKLMLVDVKLEYKGTNNQGFDEYNLYDITKVTQPSLVDCVDIQRLIAELRVIVGNIKDVNLRTLVFAMCTYQNQTLLNKLFECPVTEKSAYSFKGGTLAHIVRTCKLCDVIANVYNTWDFNLGGYNETLNVDLLKTIAIFHDLGKAEKYYFENEVIQKTFKGELLTDAEISVDIFRDVLNISNAALSDEQKVILEHAIASAKGKIDNGAITDPRTKEAEIFAAIERIECTMGNFEHLQRTNIGDNFQKLFNKQYYTENFDEAQKNACLKQFL